MSFNASVTESAQLVIALDSGAGMTELPYTLYGRAVGASQISGEALVTTTTVNSILELRNPEGNPVLTLTPSAGGAQPVVGIDDHPAARVIWARPYRRETSSATISAAGCVCLASATLCPAQSDSASISPVVPTSGGAGA